jgi:hypothetical protein
MTELMRTTRNRLTRAERLFEQVRANISAHDNKPDKATAVDNVENLLWALQTALSTIHHYTPATDHTFNNAYPTTIDLECPIDPNEDGYEYKVHYMLARDMTATACQLKQVFQRAAASPVEKCL